MLATYEVTILSNTITYLWNHNVMDINAVFLPNATREDLVRLKKWKALGPNQKIRMSLLCKSVLPVLIGETDGDYDACKKYAGDIFVMRQLWNICDE